MMKSRWIGDFISSGVPLALTLCMVSLGRCQPPPGEDPLSEQAWELKAEFEQLEHAKRAVADAKRATAHMRHAARMHAGADAMSVLREAAEELRDAKEEAAKAKSEAKLYELLSQFFDEDMERRKDELANIKERVQKLSEQLDRRRDKKQDIIDLQAKVLINESNGLGFFNNSDRMGLLFLPSGDQITINPPKFEMPVPVVYAPPPLEAPVPIGVHERKPEPAAIPSAETSGDAKNR